MTNPHYLHFGSHTDAPDTWRNFDASPTLRLQRLPLIGRLARRGELVFPPTVEYGDIVKGLPVAKADFVGIYCSHVLEHLSLEDAHVALSNIRSYLAPGGTFRLVLPDLKGLVLQYAEMNQADAAHVFMTRSLLGERFRQRGVLKMLRNWWGNATHRWMWDEVSLREALDAAGFLRIRRAEFGDSADPAFQDVERQDRWEEPAFDGYGSFPCLGMECGA